MKDNIIKSTSDTLIIEVVPKANGTMVLNSYNDEWKNLDVTKYQFNREFQIVEDDIFSTDWEPMTNASLSKYVVNQTETVLRIRYSLIKVDPTAPDDGLDIQFVKINFSGAYTPKNIVAPVLSKSIFSDIAYEDATKELQQNLFKKFYYRGILPNYITRGDNVDKKEDEDFYILFSTIARFYAIIFQHFKRFESFNVDVDLLRQWLVNNTICFDESDITLEKLQYLCNNLLDEIRKRGTRLMFKYEGDILQDGSPVPVDGEFVRLIRSKKENELIYENVPKQCVGWWLGKSSPMYRGVTNESRQLNKTGEMTEDFQNISNFRTFQKGGGTVRLEKNSGHNCLRIGTTTADSMAGLGRQIDDTSVDGIYTADPKMDYEICFMINFASIGTTSKISFGVEGFDRLKSKLDDPFIRKNSDNITEMFLTDQPIKNNFIQGKWYCIRGIIHAYGSKYTDEDSLNINRGNNLVFNNAFLRYILPKVYITGQSISTTYIYNFKIHPLVRGTNIIPDREGKQNSFSLGFLQPGRMFHAYFRNNNNSQSEAEISDIIEKYLLPFNSTNILTFINNE